MIKNVSNLLKICLYFDCILFISYVKKSLNLKHLTTSFCIQGFPDSSVGKEPACNAEDPSLIPGWGRSLGGGNGDPLQCSCLGNPMDRGIWWATVLRISQRWTQLKCLSTYMYIYIFSHGEFTCYACV